MNPKLIFYLADTAVYPLSVVLLIVALKGNVMNAGPALVRIVLFMWTVAFVASLVVARCWLGSAWHALPPLFAAFLITYLYFSWPQWKNTYIPESFDEECYEEGIARRTGKRLAGLEHGTITYYASDGRIVRSETWKHGDPNGLYRGYHDNGQLAERGVVKRPDTENGDLKRYREGRWKFYREDGTRDDVRTYEKGRVVASQSYAYYKVDQDDRRSRIYRFSDRMPFTGQLEKCGVVDDEAFPLFWTGRIVDGYFDGPWQAGYHLPGSPSAGEGVAVMGRSEGLSTAYYSNGQLWSVASYRAGKLEGEYVEYYRDSLAAGPHGRVRYRARYVGGKRQGAACWWYENGAVDTESEYRDGKRNGMTREYDEQGRLLGGTAYRDGLREGLCVWYASDGSRTETEYRADKAVGERRYGADGRLKSESR